ncbi:MAG: hypothetical protein IPK52_23250 [Chloroflexi bacterium]|nr:hypothetical protein [Chloroflexota bacterium]
MTAGNSAVLPGESSEAGNPFSTTQPAPPFAGRSELLARLHQHLTSAAVPHALTLLGRRRSGRTAFIEAARRRFDESFVWATPDLGAVGDDSAWLHALYQSGKDAASARGLSVHRLPRWPDEKTPSEQRAWLQDSGLPELFQLIRPHRRLIWVVDGAEPLAEAVARGTLQADLGEWMTGLVGTQLGILFTAHVDNEASLARLTPLVNPSNTFRLGALNEEETAELLAFGRGDPEETMAKQVHALTGGLPELALKSAAAVHEVSKGEAYSPAHLKQVRAGLAAEAAPYFRSLWENLSADEQAVMTALAYLRFERPAAALNAEDVEARLADSDYPLDLTAIFAVLRRLEFVDIVSGTHKDVSIRAGLFESWIRETVKPEHLRRMTIEMPAAAVDPQVARYGVIVLLVVLAILLIIAASGQPAPGNNDVIVPTVTLGN